MDLLLVLLDRHGKKYDQLYALLLEPAQAEMLYVLLTYQQYSVNFYEKVVKVGYYLVIVDFFYVLCIFTENVEYLLYFSSIDSKISYLIELGNCVLFTLHVFSIIIIIMFNIMFTFHWSDGCGYFLFALNKIIIYIYVFLLIFHNLFFRRGLIFTFT